MEASGLCGPPAPRPGGRAAVSGVCVPPSPFLEAAPAPPTSGGGRVGWERSLALGPAPAFLAERIGAGTSARRGGMWRGVYMLEDGAQLLRLLLLRLPAGWPGGHSLWLPRGAGWEARVRRGLSFPPAVSGLPGGCRLGAGALRSELWENPGLGPGNAVRSPHPPAGGPSRGPGWTPGRDTPRAARRPAWSCSGLQGGRVLAQLCCSRSHVLAVHPEQGVPAEQEVHVRLAPRHSLPDSQDTASKRLSLRSVLGAGRVRVRRGGGRAQACQGMRTGRKRAGPVAAVPVPVPRAVALAQPVPTCGSCT